MKITSNIAVLLVLLCFIATAQLSPPSGAVEGEASLASDGVVTANLRDFRQSVFSLDEGVYSYGSSLLVVSRGLGAVGLPWRIGADPEAVLIQIDPPTPG